MRGRYARKRSLPVRQVVTLLSVGLMLFSIYQIWHITDIYAREEQMRRQMEPYRPQETALPAVPEFVSVDDIAAPDKKPVVVNQTVADAKALNADIVGWLRLDGTGIDYPFVQAADNDYYLRRDINGDYAYAGTLFMDANANRQFTQFSSAIFGHNMLNGTMFSDVLKYKDAAFFNAFPTGWLFLEDATYQLEVFAYMEVSGSDAVVYKTDYRDEREMQITLEYIAQNAQRYRNLSLTPKDRLVLLSTCTDNLDEMRGVLFVRLVQTA